MARVIVADDVLSAQSGPAFEPDIELAGRTGKLEWLLAGWLSDVQFLVSLDDPHRLEPATHTTGSLSIVASAVRAAAERYWLVDESGWELPGSWAVSDLRTPDGVSGPLRADAGVVVATGTKDGTPMAMGETLVRILREEVERLEDLEADVHISCLPSDIAIIDLPPWEGIAPVDRLATRVDPGGEKVWFVGRSVRRMTTTGVPYVDFEYLDADSHWTWDRASGVRFAEPEVDKVRGLINEVRESGVDPDGSVTGRLQPPDADYEPDSLPPPEIRARD